MALYQCKRNDVALEREEGTSTRHWSRHTEGSGQQTRSVLILLPITWGIKKMALTLDQKWKMNVKCRHVVRVTVGWQW